MEGPVVTIEQMKSSVSEAEKSLKEVFEQQASNGSKGPYKTQLKPGKS